MLMSPADSSPKFYRYFSLSLCDKIHFEHGGERVNNSKRAVNDTHNTFGIKKNHNTEFSIQSWMNILFMSSWRTRQTEQMMMPWMKRLWAKLDYLYVDNIWIYGEKKENSSSIRGDGRRSLPNNPEHWDSYRNLLIYHLIGSFFLPFHFSLLKTSSWEHIEISRFIYFSFNLVSFVARTIIMDFKLL